MENNSFSDQELAEAMALLQSETHPSAGAIDTGPPVVESPTLARLGESRRPRTRTACETCRNSLWFASPVEVKCYCRVMFTVTWSTENPNHITECDGPYLG